MRTKAVIYIDRFLRNFHAVKSRIGQIRICVPVKADAYGHGALEIAKISLEAGAFCLGVSTVSEGSELRTGGIKAPILLFSQPNPDDIPDIFKLSLIPFISDAEFADALNRYAEFKNRVMPVHIKIDTGMGRIGCLTEDAQSLARHIISCPGLELAGTATHLAVSDSTDENDITYTKTQLTRFKDAVEGIRKAGIDPGIVHAANSGGIILHPDSWLDMVRPGIFLYGYKTAEEKDAPPEHFKELSNFEPLQAQPVMEVRAAVTLIKKIYKGESVSYGRTWIAEQDTYIAILPLGYADGLPRLVSNNWHVTIYGKPYPIVGRISMDQCCIDLGPQPNVRRWQEAVVIGSPSKNAADMAKLTGTIPYEITCNINKRVPRIYEAYGVTINELS